MSGLLKERSEVDRRVQELRQQHRQMSDYKLQQILKAKQQVCLHVRRDYFYRTRSNYANGLFSFCFGLLLFAGFLVPSCPKRALVLGNGCERFCASRSLLGSYVHQESI